MLHIVGQCETRVFGLSPAQRLERQAKGTDDLVVVADASAVLDPVAFAWLLDNPGTVLASRSGRPLAATVSPDMVDHAAAALQGAATEMPVLVPGGDEFVRKLRRRIEPGAYSLIDQPAAAVERRLFDKAYKGVTDLVTKWVWPWPAFHVTRVCSQLGITPNAVTFAGLVLVLAAGWLFYQGQLAGGLAAAWLMTFLDTVDGKLARVTCSSSRFGNLLDHGTDIIHPPIWWYCLAHGLAAGDSARAQSVWTAFVVILACYVVGRAVEIGFHRLFGFNPYIWRPFDSRFRLIVSRRNVILAIMTIGLAVGLAVEAFLLCAGWSLCSALVQLLRIGQALGERRRRPVTSWLY